MFGPQEEWPLPRQHLIGDPNKYEISLCLCHHAVYGQSFSLHCVFSPFSFLSFLFSPLPGHSLLSIFSLSPHTGRRQCLGQEQWCSLSPTPRLETGAWGNVYHTTLPLYDGVYPRHPAPTSMQALSSLPHSQINRWTQIPLKILSWDCQLVSRGLDKEGPRAAFWEGPYNSVPLPCRETHTSQNHLPILYWIWGLKENI